MIKDGTNEYARHRIAEKENTGRLTEKSRWRKWRDVIVAVVKLVLAVIINMGLVQIPELEGYWKASWESYIPFFHDVLPRN